MAPSDELPSARRRFSDSGSGPGGATISGGLGGSFSSGGFGGGGDLGKLAVSLYAARGTSTVGEVVLSVVAVSVDFCLYMT